MVCPVHDGVCVHTMQAVFEPRGDIWYESVWVLSCVPILSFPKHCDNSGTYTLAEWKRKKRFTVLNVFVFPFCDRQIWSGKLEEKTKTKKVVALFSITRLIFSLVFVIFV